jgi:IS5 family transposase
LNFRHLLEKHQLGAAIFAKVGELLLANGLKLCGGTIVDATIIAAPSSTKNQDKARVPEMHQTFKAGQWYFGMKAHIGVDSATGLIHSASVTAANEHDSQQLGNLVHGNETRLYGDSAYRGQKEALKEHAPRAKDFTNKRAYRNKPLSERDKQVNTTKSQTRAKVEHPFLTLKRHWGFAKARYRGLAKNANRAFAMLALINIEKWGKPLGA